MVRRTYDLVVIGAGSAGLSAAEFGAQLGRRVALVERDRVGGDCTWTGCVPSKALLKVAKVAQYMRTGHRFGLSPWEPAVDLRPVMAHVRSTVGQVYQNETPEALQAKGVEVLLGQARFLDKDALAVGDNQARITARRFIIATGAQPAAPPILGLESVDYLTYQSVWNLEELPRRLVVVGAGPIGCELAQAFCRLGSRVTLVEAVPRILLQDDAEAAEVVSRRLTAERIDLKAGVGIRSVRQQADGMHLDLGETEIVGDALLVCAGRTPNISGLGLDKAGLAYDATGIRVDRRLRTNHRHIYAAGDCVGGYQFTHYAAWQGFMAVRNAFLPGFPVRAVLDSVPWATFTDPELAQAGLTESRARERLGHAVRVCRWPMTKVDRAVTEEDSSDFVKLIYQPNGKIIGATIVAGQAGEMVHDWSLAIDNGLRLRHVATSIHLYPTYSMAAMQIAATLQLDQLLQGHIGRLLRGLAKLAR